MTFKSAPSMLPKNPDQALPMLALALAMQGDRNQAEDPAIVALGQEIEATARKLLAENRSPVPIQPGAILPILGDLSQMSPDDGAAELKRFRKELDKVKATLES